MFGLMDPPQLKAQKSAAKSARAMRELAGRELAVDAQMLAIRLHWATGQRDTAFANGKSALAGNLTIAIGDGQDLMDRLNYAADAMFEEAAEKWSSANSAAQFEAVASYEIDLRNVLVEIRDQARTHLNAIGATALDGR